MIASNVQIYTATHPVEMEQRLTLDWSWRGDMLGTMEQFIAYDRIKFPFLNDIGFKNVE